ncbi:riboflavin aldehyde-forming enzyme [Colletotrichum karsti]|uniref:Riboflavin aldehyde-forming enzyme n=1 Tax=Colletotrichum karsti TaxID=1095194 RepID=A0A9P6I831_9PEZI|nr:riboflavin aldehyde-forming enzyme [Colletotrichum karsti]KAF9873760.1 riboflavin aldehyde-forming enzyme [Colletotrichum karsti]
MVATKILLTAAAGIAALVQAAPFTVTNEVQGLNDINPTIAARQDMSPGPFTGEMTYYNPGLGSCGQNHGDGDMVVALSAAKLGGASNDNPLCSKSVQISYGGKTVDATVVDKCPGCASNNIDVSPAVFTALMGTLDRGRVLGVTWKITN